MYRDLTLTLPVSTNTINTFTKAQRGAVVSADDGIFDYDLANFWSVIPTANVTLANPANITAGQGGEIFIDASTYTIAFGTFYKFAGGITPTLIDDCILAYYVKSTTEIIVSEVSAYA